MKFGQLYHNHQWTLKIGDIWNVITNIHGAVQAIALALLVLFFVIGVMKTCGSFTEVKKPEHAVKLFIRFALTKGLITYGLELMMAIFKIVQGIASTIMDAAGLGGTTQTILPNEIISAVESCNFFESIPLWAVTLIRRIVYNSIVVCDDSNCLSEDSSKSIYIQQYRQWHLQVLVESQHKI